MTMNVPKAQTLRHTINIKASSIISPINSKQSALKPEMYKGPLRAQSSGRLHLLKREHPHKTALSEKDRLAPRGQPPHNPLTIPIRLPHSYIVLRWGLCLVRRALMCGLLKLGSCLGYPKNWAVYRKVSEL